MSRKQKKMLVRILISAALWIACYFPIPQPGSLVLYLISYAVIGWDVLWKAIRNILRGQVFDENFLMALATVGAMGSGEFGEGVAVMLFLPDRRAFPKLRGGPFPQIHRRTHGYPPGLRQPGKGRGRFGTGVP